VHAAVCRCCMDGVAPLWCLLVCQQALQDCCILDAVQLLCVCMHWAPTMPRDQVLLLQRKVTACLGWITSLPAGNASVTTCACFSDSETEANLWLLHTATCTVEAAAAASPHHDQVGQARTK
jgi:hypothetical protein